MLVGVVVVWGKGRGGGHGCLLYIYIYTYTHPHTYFRYVLFILFIDTYTPQKIRQIEIPEQYREEIEAMLDEQEGMTASASSSSDGACVYMH